MGPLLQEKLQQSRAVKMCDFTEDQTAEFKEAASCLTKQERSRTASEGLCRVLGQQGGESSTDRLYFLSALKDETPFHPKRHLPLCP